MKRMFGLLMMVGLLVSVGCGGDDDSSPTSSSVSQDKYSETILGTWKHDSDPMWTIEGSTLSITDADGNLTSEYPYEIKSLSSTQLVFISKIDKVDGTGTIEEEVTYTR